MEDSIKCARLLGALFLGWEEEESMPKKLHDAPSEFVSVPVPLLSGLIYSLFQGMEFLQSSYNLAERLNEVLKQRGKNAERARRLEDGSEAGTDN
jgi:hypothetical protein